MTSSSKTQLESLSLVVLLVKQVACQSHGLKVLSSILKTFTDFPSTQSLKLSSRTNDQRFCRTPSLGGLRIPFPGVFLF